MTATKTYMIGATVVHADDHGPYKFTRHGVEVDCICDPAHNLACRYHAERAHTSIVCRAEVAGVPLDGPQIHQEVP